MQTVGVVLLSIFGGAFLIILVGGLAALIWLHWRSQKMHRESMLAMAEFSKSMTGLIEGARTSFAGIRQDIRTSLQEQTGSITALLAHHDAKVDSILGKVNATALEAAAQRGLAACVRMERAAKLLEALVHTHDVQPDTNLGPEEYGPPDTIYDLRSATARMDEIENENEASESVPQYSTPNQ